MTETTIILTGNLTIFALASTIIVFFIIDYQRDKIISNSRSSILKRREPVLNLPKIVPVGATVSGEDGLINAEQQLFDKQIQARKRRLQMQKIQKAIRYYNSQGTKNPRLKRQIILALEQVGVDLPNRERE